FFMLALALPSSAFRNIKYTFFYLFVFALCPRRPHTFYQEKVWQKSRLRALLAKNTNNRRCQKNSLFELRQFLARIYWKYSCFLNARSLQAEALDRDVSLLVSIPA